MEAKEEAQSKRPERTPFKQQELPAWQPLLTPQWVIGTFAVIALVFIPIGIVIILESGDIVEIEKRYDNLVAEGGNGSIRFVVPEDMEPPIYVYYQLKNFYQNHRRYVKSRSDDQLRGGESVSGCTPLEVSGTNKLMPCGLIANSKFSDVFTIRACTLCSSPPCDAGDCPVLNATSTPNLLSDGIAWQSDKDKKFDTTRTPRPGETNISPLTGQPITIDEELMVWMRTAGLPTFRKLHRRITTGNLRAGLEIIVDIKSNFSVSAFDGEKAIVFTTTNSLGGRNEFLGWSYIAVGCLCALLTIGFAIKQVSSPRRLGDMSYFHWAGNAAKREGVESDH